MATVPSIIFELLYLIEEDGSDTTAVNKEEIKEQTNVLKDRYTEVKKWLKANPEVQKEYHYLLYFLVMKIFLYSGKN